MATNTILGLGVGLFNAALGKNYLSELANAESSGMSLLQIADVLDGIPQFTVDVMGGKTTDQQVDQFLSHYGITTGAAYTTAKGFVNNMLTSGKGFGAITVAANDYLLGSSVAADFQPAAALLKNKIAVAAAYSKTYSSDSVATLQGVLAGVTADMDTPAEIEAYLTGIGFPPGVLLTEGIDIATGHIFVAPRDFTPGGTDQVNSLNDDDVLTGTSATDDKLIFNFVNDDDTGDANIVPTMTGIEIADVEFSLDGTGILDLQDSSGFTTVNLHRIDDGGNAIIDNITEAATNNLSINRSSAPDADVSFTYLDTALTGTTDAVTLTLNNAQVDDVTIQESADDGSLDQGFETLNVVSSGAANHMTSLAAEDAQSLVITGDQDLSIFGTTNIQTVVGTNTLVEGKATIGGLLNMAGSLTKIDASALKGDLSINLNDVLQATKDGTSGTDVAVSVIGGEGDDKFWLGNGIGANDTIDGGAGGNLAVLTGGSIDGVINKTGVLEVRTNTTTDVVIDTSKLPDLESVLVRNEGNNGASPAISTAKAVDVELNKTTKAVAENGIDILHGTTGNNAIDSLDLKVDLATDGADDAVVYTIGEGVNRDPRFNFTLSSTDFETVTVEDNDSESNSVEINGTEPSKLLTIKGGEAGDFLNLDIDTAGADVTGFTTGLTADAGQNQQGLLGIDTSGSEVDYVAGNIEDVGALATQVRLGTATIDASGEIANVIVRVDTNAADTNGAQKITMGKGDDTVIFDMLSDARAGLTISDTVAGGDGTDQLVIDGNGVRVSIGASEWTNVTGFESVRTVGNGAAAISTRIGDNSYNLTLTNDLITANGGGMLIINNDNDISNDAAATLGQSAGANTAGTGVESAVTIDARSLNAQNHFTYNGEEGGWNDTVANGVFDAGDAFLAGTVDKIVFADANINGKNVIDGGAVDNLSTTFAANTDILEVRNGATVTTGDLAGIKNMGIIAGTNDQAVAQTLVLQLNDTVIDALVDSYHTSTTTEQEVLTVRMNAAADIAGPVATAILNYDASQATARSRVDITLDGVIPGAGDTIRLGNGITTVQFDIAGSFDTVGAFATSDADYFVLSAAQFGINVAAVNTTVVASGNNIIYGALGSGAATDRIYVLENTTSVAGAAAFDTQIYYDADGSGAGAAVLIGVLVDNAGTVIGGIGNTGLTIVA